MRPESIRRLQDALAKLDAKSKLISGGTQYTPGVSLQVAGINGGKALMRNQKHEGARPLPLHELQRRQK
jgi:hypothetical protein